MKMIIHFKATAPLLNMVHVDLARPHPFAAERVGYLLAGMSWSNTGLLLLARDYRPVDDKDYVEDHSVGAMMGPDAIRKALQWALDEPQALLHVHSHGGLGLPGFSSVDARENAKVVPGFFSVTPRYAHGAIVLSRNMAAGSLWLGKGSKPVSINRFSIVGAPIMTWRAA
jgi:hypothetical protein